MKKSGATTLAPCEACLYRQDASEMTGGTDDNNNLVWVEKEKL